jgi:hypothetical protein
MSSLFKPTHPNQIMKVYIGGPNYELKINYPSLNQELENPYARQYELTLRLTL